MKSIQSKILTVVILGLLVITIAVSAIAVRMTHNIMHKDADRILNNVCQKEAAYINDMLNDITKSAQIMEHYATTELESPQSLKNDAYRANYIEKTKNMFDEIALNTNGVQGYYLRLNPEISTYVSGFYNTINENGIVINQPVLNLSNYSPENESYVGWYYTAINAGEGVWLEPYHFPVSKTLLISYVVPFYVDNLLVGVIGFDLDFEYLINYIN